MRTVNIEALRKHPTQDVPSIVQYIQETVTIARRYVQAAEATGIQKNILAGEFLTYDAVRDCAQCLKEREDITLEQRTELEDIANFWAGNEELLKEGFYDGKPNGV